MRAPPRLKVFPRYPDKPIKLRRIKKQQWPKQRSAGSHSGSVSPLLRIFSVGEGGRAEPIWQFIAHLSKPHARLDISRVAFEAGISAEEINYWRDKGVLQAPNFTKALQLFAPRHSLKALPPVLPSDLSTTNPSDPATNSIDFGSNLPDWLVLQLITHKILTIDCAQLATPFAISRIPYMASTLVSPLLILTANSLANWSLQSPIGNLLHHFIYLPDLVQPAAHFNAFIDTLARFPKDSQLVAKYIVRMLETMKERQIFLRSQTYNKLLQSQALTLELTKMLRERMIHEGHRPTAKQLEYYLKFFSSQGNNSTAERYLDVLRYATKATLKPTPHSGSLVGETNPFDQITEANLSYFKGLSEDPNSAFGYLKRLSTTGSRESLAAKMSYVSEERNRRRINGANVERNVRGEGREQLLAYRLISKGNLASAKDLMSILSKEKVTMSSKQGVYVRAWLNITIQGLIRRRHFQEAYQTFNDALTSTGDALIDPILLRTGVKAQAYSGDAFGAFRTLMKYTHTRASTIGRKKLHQRKRFELDVKIFNDFMLTMHRIGRPDAVFALWENMGRFNMVPDGTTMLVLLDASRLTVRNFSRRSFPYQMSADVNVQADTGVSQVLARASDDAHLTPLWRGLQPWKWSRAIFLGMLFNSFPQLREFEHHMPIWGAHLPAVNVEDLPPFPVSSKPFLGYIHLMITLSTGERIPSILEWMHILNVPFNRKLLAMGSVGWEEYSSSTPGVQAGKRLLDWVQMSRAEILGGLPTEKDLLTMRRRLFFEKQSIRGAT